MLVGFTACSPHFLTHECSWSHWQPRSCSTAGVWHVSPPQCAVAQDVVTICCWFCSHVSFLANPEEGTLALQPFLSHVGKGLWAKSEENLAFFPPAFCNPQLPEATPFSGRPAGNTPLSCDAAPVPLPLSAVLRTQGSSLAAEGGDAVPSRAWLAAAGEGGPPGGCAFLGGGSGRFLRAGGCPSLGLAGGREDTGGGWWQSAGGERREAAWERWVQGLILDKPRQAGL